MRRPRVVAVIPAFRRRAVRRSVGATAGSRATFLRRLAVLAAAMLAGAVATSVALGSEFQRNDTVSDVPSARGKHEKLASQLVALDRLARERDVAGAATAARAARIDVSAGKVRVVVQAEPRERGAARTALTAVEGEAEAEYGGTIQGLVPLGALDALARKPGVRYVDLPVTFVPSAVPGEGIAFTNAAAWHAAGQRGTGVKIAVIDGGFTGYAARQAAGDLPASITTVDHCGGNLATASEHGTAVAEIVHEMAPAAQLFLICIRTQVELGLAKDYAKANGIHIVNLSGGFANSSRGDGSGGPGTADAVVADARASGILWVNAAGNHAQRHWTGVFSDPNSNYRHNFTALDEGNSFSLPFGQVACASLKWDSWPVTGQDYDLFIRREADGFSVASSANLQNGTQRPTESACYVNATGLSQNLFIGIEKFNASLTPRLDLFLDVGPSLEHVVPDGSVVEPASSPHAMAVGALCWQTAALEPYSSRGPTIDGRIKPDIAGPDSVSSGTYGLFSACGLSGFPGTSASSPHVAGAAALVKQANPTFTAAQLQSFLEGRATDLGAPGKDNLFGAGRLGLGAFATTPPPPPPPPAPPPPPSTADTQRPAVAAVGSAGRAGRVVRLRYRVSDNSGRTREQVQVFRSTRRLATIRAPLAASVAGTVYYVTWRAPRTAGLLRFCVRAWDPAGNRSALSCARLRLR